LNLPGLEYDSPQTFTLQQRVTLRVLPFLAGLLIKALLRTCRYTVRDKHLFTTACAGGPVLISIFHENILYAVYHFRGTNFHGMTSYSFDGEMAVRVLRQFGLDAVRGSSSRGGSAALKNMMAAMQHVGAVGFTIDGPRGPRRVAKAGMSVLSARTGRPVVPMAFAIKRAKRLRSWDHFPIAYPFTRVYMRCGTPLPPPSSTGVEAVEMHRQQLEAAMNALHRELEAEVNPDNPPFPYDASTGETPQA
jgi:lysophospholipid acyltransferase (LPLAT)-like uncharacterized protein